MRERAARCLAIVAFVIFPLVVFATNKNPVTGPVPSWVKRIELADRATASSLNVDRGYLYLLCDRQENVALAANYRRFSQKIVSDAGLQEAAQISIDYDPLYQQLIFHSIKIIRGSTVIDKLDMTKVKVIQQETELDRYLYNGTLSAVLFLEDIRKGDIIDYEYSIKGYNPVFSGKFFSSATLQFTVPVKQLSYTLHYPQGRKLYMQCSDSTLKPAVEKRGSSDVYSWHCSNVEGLYINDNLPSWYYPLPYLELTEFKEWKDVAEWALPHYAVNTPITTAMEQEISRIREQYNTPEEQLVAAVRFVQNEVRYLGMELGISSHKPAAPSKVFAQRFGDCKDKTLLLCNMLYHLGIEAHPMLVDSRGGEEMPRLLPTPAAFDHVTVQVKLNGRTCWIDPTISYQGGKFGSISFPDYGYGLVIAGNTAGLTKIGRTDIGTTAVKEFFDIEDLDGKAALTVTTIYTGSDADRMRYDLASTSLAGIEERYLNFYVRDHPSLVKEKDIEVSDNLDSNRLVITEHYRISEMWQEGEVGGELKMKAGFKARLLQEYIATPQDHKRTMPYGLKHPLDITQTIEISTPDDWTITAESDVFSDEHVKFNYSYQWTGKTVKLQYAYRTLADHVPPARTTEFIELMNKIYDYTSYELYWTRGAMAKRSWHINWSFLFFFLFLTGAVVYGGIKAVRIDTGIASSGSYYPIGGWLVAICVMISLFTLIHLSMSFLSFRFFGLAWWLDYTAPGGKFFSPGWAPLILFRVISDVALCAYGIVLLVLFASRRSTFPRLFIIFLIAKVALLGTNYLVSLAFRDLPGELKGPSLVWVAIVTVLCAASLHYTLASERVKNTFINPLGRRQW